MMTGVVSDRSSTSAWNVASVTSMIVAAPPLGWSVGGAGDVGAEAGGAVEDGAGGRARSRSPLRSTAPRMTAGIAGVVRGSMVP
jgi:hypothetical protein